MVKKLTSLYFNRASPLVKGVMGNREKGDLDNMMKQEQVNMQLLANKANARWVEAFAVAAKEQLEAATAAKAEAGKGGQAGAEAGASAGPEADGEPKGKPGWCAPSVLDNKTLHAGGVDVEMYKKVGVAR